MREAPREMVFDEPTALEPQLVRESGLIDHVREHRSFRVLGTPSHLELMENPITEPFDHPVLLWTLFRVSLDRHSTRIPSVSKRSPNFMAILDALSYRRFAASKRGATSRAKSSIEFR